ncbi:MAG: PH domain-containing protein [Alphaproteobacteria bacterium]
MASYVEKVLLPDEKVLFCASIHWVIYLQGLFITICGGLLSVYCYDISAKLFGTGGFGGGAGRVMSGIALIVVLAGVSLLLGAYLRQISTELVLTDRRIIAKYGIVSRSTFEIMATRITGANFEQTIVGRILGYGTILVHGAGGEVSPVDLVTEPQKFHKALLGILEHSQPTPAQRPRA